MHHKTGAKKERDSGLLPDQDPLPEPKKQTRGFVSAISHNLVDDVKHLPRRNSLYWFIPGKYIGATEVQIA